MLAWLKMIGWVYFAGIFFFSMRRPRFLRVGMGFFRRRWPIFRSPFASFAGATYLITRADDTQEVLRRAHDFLLGPVNEKKILTGDFIIALDPERRYLTEKTNAARALPPERIRDLERFVDDAARPLLAEPIDGSFNVTLYVERITVAIVRDFWGLDPDGARSNVVEAQPGFETMRLWLRKLAIVLASMEPAPLGIREVGLQCSEEFLSYVRAECAVHPQNNQDMIAHILRESRGNMDETVRSIAGLTMTGAAVVTKAFSQAFDQLLNFPDALDAAITASMQEAQLRAAGRIGEARQRRMFVGRILVEALRFNPVFPVIPRYCVRSTTLARGTDRETEIPAGSNVIVSPLGAMFDPNAVIEPERFGFARNIQLNSRTSTMPDWDYGSRSDGTPGDYVIFGGGEHWCMGDQMAICEMASMAVALLNRLCEPTVPRGARRRPYRVDQLRYDNSAAESLLVGAR
ncbi:MAG TPA: cytochrome P450 [Burkholderiales bacterium]|nr:cytochrome P450 [Burkholderiales bacterium]